MGLLGSTSTQTSGVGLLSTSTSQKTSGVGLLANYASPTSTTSSGIPFSVGNITIGGSTPTVTSNQFPSSTVSAPVSPFVTPTQLNNFTSSVSKPSVSPSFVSGTTISAGTPSFLQTLTQYLPTQLQQPFENIVNDLHDSLIGNTKDKAFIARDNALGAHENLSGINDQSTIGAILSGILAPPFQNTGETNTEKIDSLANSLIQGGTNPDRAATIAMYSVLGGPNGTSAKTQLDSLNLTPSEASTVKWAPVQHGIAVAGELFNFVPGIGAETKVLTEAAKTIAVTEDVTKTAATLQKLGIPEDIAKQVAPALTSQTNKDVVLKQITDLKNASLTPAEIASKEVTQKIIESAAAPTKIDRGFVTSVSNYAPELAAKVAGQYIPRSTDTLASMARDFIARDEVAAIEVAKTSNTELGVATAGELITKYVNAAREATISAMKNMYLDQAAEIANTAAPKLTELGRAVQAASILGRLSPEAVVRTVAKDIAKYNAEKSVLGKLTSKEVPALTGQQVDTLTKMADAVQNLPEGVQKSIETHQLLDHMASLIPSGWFDKVLAVWKAGLLTGVKTSGLNTLSNLFNGASEFIKDIPAAGIDKIASLFTKERTLALTAGGYTTKSLRSTQLSSEGKIVSGIRAGVENGWRYFKTGYDERMADPKLEYKKVNFGSSPVAKAIQKYEETIFRTLGAEDQPFYYGAKAHSIVSQAQAMWSTTRISGRVGANGFPIVKVVFKDAAEKAASKQEFIDHYIENPTDIMLKNATHDAEMAVFQNQTNIAKGATALKNAIPLSELIIPFSRTPAAVAMQLINYSPIGAAKPVLDAILSTAGKKEFNQRAFSQEMGRAVIGTGVMWLGMQLYNRGKVSLGYPTDEKTQQEWKAEGKQENSILFNGHWIQAQAFGPVGAALVVGGWFGQGLKTTGSVWDGLTQAAIGAGTSLTQQTFLSGVESFTQALNNPVQYAGTMFRGLIGSIVPTIAADIATATDPLQRRTSLDSNNSTILGSLESRIPGLRETLQPQIDVYGNPIKRSTGPISSATNPFRPTTQSTDPTILEVSRLQDAGFSASPTQLGNKNGYADLTPAQNTAMWERAGVILKGKLDNLFKDPRYQQLDDTDKAKMISDFATKAGDIARAEAVLTLTQDLQGPELKTELSKLKKDGLLTQSVFDVWQSIH